MENAMNHGMKWHKFLIYFSIWVSAIYNLYLGLAYLYFGSDSPVYYCIGGIGIDLRVIFQGIGLVACGVYLIAVCFKLAKFKKGAPNHLLLAQLASALSTTLFMMREMDASFSIFLYNLPVIVVNRCYYGKRAKRFVN